MTKTESGGAATNEDATAPSVELKLEAIVIPVADVDRSKLFYGGLGWRLDADFTRGDNFRVVQYTPPGSACSIHFGRGVTSAVPGSVQGLYLVVSDIEAACAELAALGAPVSKPFHRDEKNEQITGPDPARRSYSSFATFEDPDGNSWLLQEITERLPGRVDATGTLSMSAGELAGALRRAAAARGEHEKLTGQHDENWSDWYADYIIRAQGGKPLPT